MNNAKHNATPVGEAEGPSSTWTAQSRKRFLLVSVCLILLHVAFVLVRYGQLPIAPVLTDEVVINDPAISLAHGRGYVAESFADSKYGLDHVFAHFPPVYPYTESLAFRAFGVSAYSLRLTTTVMSIGSTILLLLLLYRLCAFGFLRWDVALLVEALYCTSFSLISFERMARMESMIGLLTLASLGAIFYACTLPARARLWPSMLFAAVCGALTIAVHPEGFTAVILLAALMLYLVPAKPSAKIGIAALFVLVPLAVGLAIYRSQILTAATQFLAIAHDAAAYNPTSSQRIFDGLRVHDVSTVNRNSFVLSMMVLFALAPLVHLLRRNELSKDSFQYRLGLCLAVVGSVEFLLMAFALQLDYKRCQYLFGPMLVCLALSYWGGRPLLRWHRVGGAAIVALQCVAVLFYLSARSDRKADMDPDRFRALIRSLPAGASVASTPGLWLDFKEENRPFTLILNGLDGEVAWGAQSSNPLGRFDIVIMERSYTRGRDWLQREAEDGRSLSVYRAGTTNLDIYVRSATVFNK